MSIVLYLVSIGVCSVLRGNEIMINFLLEPYKISKMQWFDKIDVI